MPIYPPRESRDHQVAYCAVRFAATVSGCFLAKKLVDPRHLHTAAGLGCTRIEISVNDQMNVVQANSLPLFDELPAVHGAPKGCAWVRQLLARDLWL